MMDLCRPLQVPPSAKAILMVLAYMHHDDGDLYPSLTYLEESTCLSRGSVVDAVKTLEACGVVVCNRANRMRTLYRVLPHALDASKIPASRRTASRQASANAPLPTSSNAPLAGTPETDTSSTATSVNAPLALVQMPDQLGKTASANARPELVQMPSELVQMPAKLVGQLDPISKEQLDKKELIDKKAETEIFVLDGSGQQEAGTPEKKSPRKKPKVEGFDPLTVELPDCISRDLWTMWVTDLRTRNKRPTPLTVEQHIEHLTGYHAQGLDLTGVIKHSISSMYRRPFPPPAQKFSTPFRGKSPAITHSFDQKEYHDGPPPA